MAFLRSERTYGLAVVLALGFGGWIAVCGAPAWADAKWVALQRGGSSGAKIWPMHAAAKGPLARTIPRPAGPAADARAAIVSPS